MPALSVRALVLQEPALIGRSCVSSQLFRHGPIERNLGLVVTDGTSESRRHSGNLYPNMGRTLFGGLVLNHIPVFDQNPVLDAYDVGCNPVHRLAEARKPPVHDFEISMEAIWKSNWNK